MHDIPKSHMVVFNNTELDNAGDGVELEQHISASVHREPHKS